LQGIEFRDQLFLIKKKRVAAGFVYAINFDKTRSCLERRKMPESPAGALMRSVQELRRIDISGQSEYCSRSAPPKVQAAELCRQNQPVSLLRGNLLVSCQMK
jgi:hypothetical protein